MSWDDQVGAHEARELVAPARYPNLLERVVRLVLHAVAIITLALASLLMLTLIQLGARMGDAVDRVNAPDVLPTGCPAGDGQCGG
jgi:hypothetical protein